jgi:hypothetical protein
MTGDTSSPSQDDRPLQFAEESLNRLLVEQFYEDSVAQYGTESEQARLLSRVLSYLGGGRRRSVR